MSMLKYLSRLFLCGVSLIGSSFAAGDWRPAHFGAAAGYRRTLTSVEFRDFVERNTRPHGMGVGEIYARAWETLFQGVGRLVPDHARPPQFLPSLQAIKDIEEMQRGFSLLSGKDRRPNAHKASVEAKLKVARQLFAPTLENHVRPHVRSFVGAGDLVQRTGAMNDLRRIVSDLPRVFIGDSQPLLCLILAALRDVPAGQAVDVSGLLPFERSLALNANASRLLDARSDGSVDALRARLKREYDSRYISSRAQFFADPRNLVQRRAAAAEMRRTAVSIVSLNELRGRERGSWERHASFFVWLATNDFLDVTEIGVNGINPDLDQRTINSVLGFSNRLRGKVDAGMATVSDLESAMNCAKKLSLLRKRTGARLDSQGVLDALRYVVLGLDEGRINGIYDRHGGTEARRHGGAGRRRGLLRDRSSMGLFWSQIAYGYASTLPAGDPKTQLCRDAYAILSAVKEGGRVRSMTTGLYMAAFITQHGLVPGGVGDSAELARRLFEEYERAKAKSRDREEPEEPVAKRRRPGSKEESLYVEAGAKNVDRLAKEVAEALEEETDDESEGGSSSDSSSSSDDDSSSSSDDDSGSGRRGGAAAAAIPSRGAAAAASALSPPRGMVRGALRPLPLAVPLSPSGAAAAAFPSPSRVGKGLGSPHVSPLDKARETFVMRMHSSKTQEEIFEMLQDPEVATREGFPERVGPVTKHQVGHAIVRGLANRVLTPKRESRKRPRDE